MHTIEFGCRYNSDLDNIVDLLRLKDLYDFQHLQVISSDSEQLQKTLDQIDVSIGKYDLEVSCLIKPQNQDFLSVAETIFGVLRNYPVKYLIFEVDNTVLASSIALFDLVKNFRDILQENRKLGCINMYFDNHFGLYLNTFRQAGQLTDLDFLLLAVELDELQQINALTDWKKELYEWFAIIQLNVNLRPSNFQNTIAPFLNDLYLLPWKERPVIFTNPLSEDYWIFQKFVEIIEHSNYYYP